MESVTIQGSLDEKTALVRCTKRDYVLRFENMTEFREFMLYFVFIKKAYNHKSLFEPTPEVRSADPVHIPHQEIADDYGAEQEDFNGGRQRR